MTTSDKKPRRTTKTPRTPKAADPAAPAVSDTKKASAAATVPASAAPAGLSTSPGLNSENAVRAPRSASSREARIQDISVSMTSRHREDRHASIALAAYFRSESRGFAPGHEVEDWLAAEEEVDQRLMGEGRVS